MNFLSKLNLRWQAISKSPVIVLMSLVLFGIVLSLFSFGLGLADIRFSGQIAGVELSQYPPDTEKQVGFLWAPNWALAAVIFIPLIIYLLCVARSEVEPAISKLVERGMLRNADGSPADPDKISRIWDRAAATSMIWALAIILIDFIAVMLMDFIPVVAKWLLYDDTVPRIITCLTNDVPPQRIPDCVPATLAHPVYEYDWSISALFSEHNPPYAIGNLIFSFLAYLYVGFVGAGVVLAGFFWFLAVPLFASAGNLRKHGLELVPDPSGQDNRCGFEVFESMYLNLILAGLATAILALMMHLQNVYLRSAEFESFFAMAFGSAFTSIANGVENRDVFSIFGELRSFRDVLPTGATLQFAATAIGLFLLTMLLVCTLLLWLRLAGNRGVDILLEDPALSDEEHDDLLDRLEEFRPWPVPALPFVIVFSMIGLIMLSMFYVNFLTIVIVASFGWLLAQLTGHVRGSFAGRTANKRRRKRAKRPKDKQ